MHRFSEIAKHNQTHQWPNFDRHVRWRSSRLARLFRLSYHDREDLHQSMTLDLVKAMHRYDPARASRETFASRVLDKSYMHHARRLAKANTGPLLIPLDANAHKRDHRRPGDLDEHLTALERGEVRRLVDALPDDLTHLAYQISRQTVVQVAESNGVHRGTIYRRIHKLQPFFENRFQEHE
jgi:RNA polymerase sigma factor (sigma-70 family)